MSGFDIVTNELTRARYHSYYNQIKLAIKNNHLNLSSDVYDPAIIDSSLIGQRLFFELKKQYDLDNSLQLLDLDTFIKALQNTTATTIFPEAEDARIAKTEWNEIEYQLLANTPKILHGVTPYYRVTYKPQVSDLIPEKDQKKIDLFYIHSPLVNEKNPMDFMRCFKNIKLKEGETLEDYLSKIPAANIKKFCHEHFDKEAYKQLLKERILSGLAYFNNLYPNGFVLTIPALGCQSFAGCFQEHIKSQFLSVMKEIFIENQNELKNLKGIVYTDNHLPPNTTTKNEIGPNKIPLIVTNKTVGSAPQLDAAIKALMPDIDNYAIVCGIAADPYSKIHNDYNRGSPSTYEGGVAQTTDGPSILTGKAGENFINDKGQVEGWRPARIPGKPRTWETRFPDQLPVNINKTDSYVKNFLMDLKNLLDHHKGFYQSKTYISSKTINQYHQILKNEKMDDYEKFNRIITIAEQAIQKRRKHNTIDILQQIKFSGERNEVTKLHQCVLNAKIDPKKSSNVIYNDDLAIKSQKKEERKQLRNELLETFGLDEDKSKNEKPSHVIPTDNLIKNSQKKQNEKLKSHQEENIQPDITLRPPNKQR